jgi:peptidoglycan/xylan/chitin deacetylase (PgdA/CDA1 family)
MTAMQTHTTVDDPGLDSREVQRICLRAVVFLAGAAFLLHADARVARSETSPSPTAFAWPKGKRAALSLTFDDARPSQVDAGLPLLNGHGVKATFYVQPEGLGKRLDGWKAAVASGHEIGNHTISHPCTGNYAFSRENGLEDYTLDRIEAEMTGANELIRRDLGISPTSFAYPCGQTFVGRGLDVRSYVPIVAVPSARVADSLARPPTIPFCATRPCCSGWRSMDFRGASSCRSWRRRPRKAAG